MTDAHCTSCGGPLILSGNVHGGFFTTTLTYDADSGELFKTELAGWCADCHTDWEERAT